MFNNTSQKPVADAIYTYDQIYNELSVEVPRLMIYLEIPGFKSDYYTIQDSVYSSSLAGLNFRYAHDEEESYHKFLCVNPQKEIEKLFYFDVLLTVEQEEDVDFGIWVTTRENTQPQDCRLTSGGNYVYDTENGYDTKNGYLDAPVGAKLRKALSDMKAWYALNPL